MSDRPDDLSAAQPPMAAPYVAMLAQIDALRLQLDALSALVRGMAGAQAASAMRQAAPRRTTAPGGMPVTFGGSSSTGQQDEPSAAQIDALTDRLSSAAPSDGAAG